MKQIWVRFAEAKDEPQFAEWVKAAQEINLFDPSVMSYPTTKTLCAHTDEEAKLFMPYQLTLTMESLAPKPGIAPIEEALALREIAKAINVLASQAAIREVYFLCKDERVVKFAENHGFEKLPYTTMRLKV